MAFSWPVPPRRPGSASGVTSAGTGDGALASPAARFTIPTVGAPSFGSPAMPILVECDGCRRKLKVPDTSLGKTVKCPRCEARFVVRAPQTEAEAAPAPPPAKAPVQPTPPPPVVKKAARPAAEEDSPPPQGTGKRAKPSSGRAAQRPAGVPLPWW